MSDVREFTVAVAGNPNSGKTTLFNMLTGGNQTVGNYPGVTVEKKIGRIRLGDLRVTLVDLPGTYSLTAYSQEEVVARDFIVSNRPDAVIDVVDASNLERNLYLALQLLEMGVPVVVALNMHDIALQRGIRIDIAKLSSFLGVPVVVTVGHRNEGRREMEQILRDLASGSRSFTPVPVLYGPSVEEALNSLTELISEDDGLRSVYPARWLAVKLLEQDREIMDRVRTDGGNGTAVLDAAQKAVSRLEAREGDDPATIIAEHRYGHASGLVRNSVVFADRGATVTDAVDTIVCNRFLGFFFVALAVFVAFKLTFQLADGWEYIPWVGGLRSPVGVFGWIFDEWLPGFIAPMPEGPLKSMLSDGIVAGVGGVMGFVPLIFFMFLMLGVIEDSGYIARIAFVLDRVLRTFGLQGKSILALIVSGGIAGGCAVPGVMATRTLREERDRLTTMLVAPFMNCGAKMPVYGMLIGAFFFRHRGEMLWLLAVLSWCFALVAALCLRKTVVRGEQTPFVMELPPYHIPVLRGVLRSAAERSWMYLRKAATIILGVSILLWAMMYFPGTDMAPFDGLRADARTRLLEEVADGPRAGLFAPDRVEETLATVAVRLASAEDAVPLEDPVLQGLAEEAASGAARSPDALALQRYFEALGEADAQGRQARLVNSLAGRLGRFLEPVSRAAGFDWRDNIALIGGFAAKEVVISTLGMAYSMGDVEAEDPGGDASQHPLARTLRNDPRWGPLRAFSLILFVMLYAPCLVTVATIRRESGSWRWALFSMVYTTTLAFVVAVTVYRVGLLLGLGAV